MPDIQPGPPPAADLWTWRHDWIGSVNESFSKAYLEALMAGVEGLTQRLPEIAEAGERVAGRLVAGGRLFLASVRPDFASEGMVRSGGLMLVEEWTPTTSSSTDDTVIVGWSATSPDQDLELLGRLRESGALIVGIGPAPPARAGVDALAGVDLLLESSTLVPAAVTAPYGGETYPLISLQNLVVLWVLTGEIVGALTRLGQMPAMYQSVLVPGAGERNSSIGGSRFHSTHEVPAIPAGQLGGDYLNGISGILRALIEEEAVEIDRVGKVCAQVLRAGRVIHAGMVSHFPMYQNGAPGDPMHMQRLEPLAAESPSVPEIESKLQPGDLFFFLGYYRRPEEAYRAARLAGALIVEVITGDGSGEAAGTEPDYVIRPRWPFGDALVRVPGYDVEILPSSGIVQTAIYWAAVGSISQALSG